MSMFNRSNRPSIYGGTFNAYTSTVTGPTAFERLMRAVSSNAFYDSDDRPDPPKCHENTRVAVINRIMDWATGKIDKDAFMLWLYGPAGAGKTAIVRNAAERFEEHGLLLASFLFFRSDPNRNTVGPLVASIAYSVSCVIPGARDPINHAVEEDPLILSYSVEAQLKKLLFKPLRLLVDQGYFLNTQFPPLILIDGLDECLDKDAQTNLIQLLSSSVAQYQLPLKFLLASRPELHIKSAISSASKRSTISHLELNDDFAPDEDIRLFLTDEFHEIKKCHHFRSQIPLSWPSQHQIETLVRKASGQFIYASLAVRFINSPYDSPKRQLDVVLELRPPINQNLPFSELDELYQFILSHTTNPDLLSRILGVHLVFATFLPAGGVSLIEAVLGLEEGDVRIFLGPLISLLEVRGSGGEAYITFHHSSFMDFLQTRGRSKDYYVDERMCHTLVAQWALKAFTSWHIPNWPSNMRRADLRKDSLRILWEVDLIELLKHSPWTPELEHALENFSLDAFLDGKNYDYRDYRNDIAEEFFDYLQQANKAGLHRIHANRYLEHAMLVINNHPSAEKFFLLTTVWNYYYTEFQRLCIKLFGFDSEDVAWDRMHYRLMRHPGYYRLDAPYLLGPIYGHIADTKRALSRLYIPISASFLYPRRIKRVRKAIDAYLEKFGPIIVKNTKNVGKPPQGHFLNLEKDKTIQNPPFPRETPETRPGRHRTILRYTISCGVELASPALTALGEHVGDAYNIAHAAYKAGGKPISTTFTALRQRRGSRPVALVCTAVERVASKIFYHKYRLIGRAKKTVNTVIAVLEAVEALCAHHLQETDSVPPAESITSSAILGTRPSAKVTLPPHAVSLFVGTFHRLSTWWASEVSRWMTLLSATWPLRIAEEKELSSVLSMAQAASSTPMSHPAVAPKRKRKEIKVNDRPKLPVSLALPEKTFALRKKKKIAHPSALPTVSTPASCVTPSTPNHLPANRTTQPPSRAPSVHLPHPFHPRPSMYLSKIVSEFHEELVDHRKNEISKNKLHGLSLLIPVHFYHDIWG
ncbi:hypothetical protein M413DRAFT_25649 [Hebeloma cylindrosporum]|uniref:NACHT domain-containing protein n=1 Tax=Hebeloma cylindrosporum TaxID=76867 RepID=A0A0C2Y2Z6_HEBCY|nr:hypothetical protein M413DRAFT_25649 [Hebeloma cylindrosporum h7]